MEITTDNLISLLIKTYEIDQVGFKIIMDALKRDNPDMLIDWIEYNCTVEMANDGQDEIKFRIHLE